MKALNEAIFEWEMLPKKFFQIIFPGFYTTEQMFIYLSKYENIGYTHALWNLKK